MNLEEAIRGNLFARDFICESITDTPEWKAINDEALDALRSDLLEVFDAFPIEGAPNESQTEDDLIWPILARLGWTASLRQQNLSARGRTEVPDGLLFADQASKRRANQRRDEWRRYELGLALVEAKRWLCPLDQGSGSHPGETVPSTQVLRYLRRADDLTTGVLRWGLLTNGAIWRLYYQGARSIAEDYFEIDLRQALGILQFSSDLFSLTDDDQRHCLKVFLLVLRREAFRSSTSDPRSFHLRAIDESRYYEERVAADLSNVVFGTLFPRIVQAIAEETPNSRLSEVREASLVLLYRLLFIHYAEDRGLLPIGGKRYGPYAFRRTVRDDVGHRLGSSGTFSSFSARYWDVFFDLSRTIDMGDQSIGLPPYNGGLFSPCQVPLLSKIRLSDTVMADIIDALSFEQTPNGRRYINYSDLSVQQLGSIYERLIEQELVRDGDSINVRPNIYARKTSGSYYTPDELVELILSETVGPLINDRLSVFERAVSVAKTDTSKDSNLEQLDPSESILRLKICDPAMGSGHFLVRLVDYLSEQVIVAMADSENAVDGYISPTAKRIEKIRDTILVNAKRQGWSIDRARLEDRNIVRRMVLKRCVFGVDKNPMAVELAKVALWLHTFTVGAPLSFLDHHIRCGDSLFGCWVRTGIDKAAERGGSLYLDGPIKRAMLAEDAIRIIEDLPDSEISEASQSSQVFSEVAKHTAPLRAFLSLVSAFEWLEISDRKDKAALSTYFSGALGDPVAIADGTAEVSSKRQGSDRVTKLLKKASRLADEERFFNWQVEFPGVWTDWRSRTRRGGFDAIVGNPPWDRIKLQQIEWFSTRRVEIAMARRATDRKRMIGRLESAGDSLADEFHIASTRAASASRVARQSGEYPLLGRGDINLYSLFVERSMDLLNRDGLVGLLIPSGIAGDKTAATFFRSVATTGRLKALFDFENRRLGLDGPPFFPAVHRSFKFCVFVALKSRRIIEQDLSGRVLRDSPARCGFFLQSVGELRDRDRWFCLSSREFGLVNPNTGTAPIFRSRKAAEITKSVYRRLPVLVDRSSGESKKAWPVKYHRMIDMTNDSTMFRSRRDLEKKEHAWPVGNNKFKSAKGSWLPLYEGKMVQAFDHRAASVIVNPENPHRPGQPVRSSLDQHQDPSWIPDPRYWIPESATGLEDESFLFCFKDVTAPTNKRSMIASLVPRSGAGNTLPLVFIDDVPAQDIACLVANFNSIPLDYVARQKIQGQHLNWFVVEQLPVVPRSKFETIRFGGKTARQIVSRAVLELSYAAHDMAPFAREMDYVTGSGDVRPPFSWNEDRRLKLRAKLDALFFLLYGIIDREDVRFVYSTFPIVEKKEVARYGRYRTRDLCLAYMNALEGGEPDAEISL